MHSQWPQGCDYSASQGQYSHPQVQVRNPYRGSPQVSVHVRTEAELAGNDAGARLPSATASEAPTRDDDSLFCAGTNPAHSQVIAERFRTRLCENFMSSGGCPYGKHCMFAHGEDQLRTMERNLADGIVNEEAIRRFRVLRMAKSRRRGANRRRNRRKRAAMKAGGSCVETETAESEGSYSQGSLSDDEEPESAELTETLTIHTHRPSRLEQITVVPPPAPTSNFGYVDPADLEAPMVRWDDMGHVTEELSAHPANHFSAPSVPYPDCEGNPLSQDPSVVVVTPVSSNHSHSFVTHSHASAAPAEVSHGPGGALEPPGNGGKVVHWYRRNPYCFSG
jgi:hypothetical protein